MDSSTSINFILTVAAPDLLDPKSATHNSKPRLSFSVKPVVLNTPEDECDTRITVMRWKTVSAIFFLVVLYLIIGATVFKALEQPHESLKKMAILEEKLEFLATHTCVNSSELEDLVKVGGSSSSIVLIIQILCRMVTYRIYISISHSVYRFNKYCIPFYLCCLLGDCKTELQPKDIFFQPVEPQN